MLRAASAALSAEGSAAPVAATAATAGGHGSHVSAMRSLGLLHELQDYVSSLQHTQQQQERELGKLKAEKREVEQVLKRELRSPERQPYLQHFAASEVADLPPRLRALFEDNKVLKEQLRRYKARAGDAERQCASLEGQLLAARDAARRLKAQLAEGAAGDAGDEAACARQQADALGRALEKLQHAHQVLQLKLDTDSRLHRQALASAARERHTLEEQVEQLQQQLDGKDREARAAALAAKQTQRRAEEARAVASKATQHLAARVAEAVAAEAARHKAAEDARLHLMLCVLREPCTRCERQRAAAAAAAAAAAEEEQQQQHQLCLDARGSAWADSSAGATPSASGGGYEGSLSREQAALLLQAGARGYLARKQLRQQRQDAAQALVLVQAGGAGLQVGSDESASLAAVQPAGAGWPPWAGGAAGVPGASSSSGCGSSSSGCPLPMELPTLRPSSEPGTASPGAAAREAAARPAALPASASGTASAAGAAGRRGLLSGSMPVPPRKPGLPAAARGAVASAPSPRPRVGSNRSAAGRAAQQAPGPGSSAAVSEGGGSRARTGSVPAAARALRASETGSSAAARQLARGQHKAQPQSQQQARQQQPQLPAG